jgi:hypothetical protein
MQSASLQLTDARVSDIDPASTTCSSAAGGSVQFGSDGGCSGGSDGQSRAVTLRQRPPLRGTFSRRPLLVALLIVLARASTL